MITLGILANCNIIQNLAAPLAPPQGTLVCRGTLVGNHCLNGYPIHNFSNFKLKKLTLEKI